MGLKLGKILYFIIQHVHTTFKISTSFISQIYPLRWVFFYEKTAQKFTLLWSVKILIDGVMVVKLGKIVYVFTQHVHTTFKSLPQNIPVEMLFLFKKRLKIHIILVCKLYIYRAIDLKLGKLVYIITLHVHVRFQVSIALHCENILDFVILYHKSGKKIDRLLVCKIHISQLNGLKFSENVYSNKAHLKI